MNNDVVLDAMLESRIWRLRTWFLSLGDLQVMQETNRFQPTVIITEIERQSVLPSLISRSVVVMSRTSSGSITSSLYFNKIPGDSCPPGSKPCVQSHV